MFDDDKKKRDEEEENDIDEALGLAEEGDGEGYDADSDDELLDESDDAEEPEGDA